jgi:hypothetical protein
MSEDPNQGSARLGMAATAGAGPGQRRRARAAPTGQPRSAWRTDECISYHPNAALALAIVRAWSDNAFKNRLLTFPVNMQTPQVDSTRAALREVGIAIDPPLRPVVLTQQQYPTYTRLADDIVFVLPDPIGATHSLHNAELAMTITCMGM